MLRRYMHGVGGGDDPLVWFEGAGPANSARRYLYADERGSIVAITDANGQCHHNGYGDGMNMYAYVSGPPSMRWIRREWGATNDFDVLVMRTTTDPRENCP